ncbi:RDD family protein [Streptomyces sp. NPDC048196]|uniref:RDD family protein n=1 Tax=Streptomyces sp. NPDC048196 TaxID=3154712 RepID=UPI0033C9B253
MNACPPVLANPGRRLLAVVIDVVIAAVALSVLSAAIGLVVALGRPADNSPFYLTLLAAVAMVFLYSPLLTAGCGGTVGKLICGLTVVRVADGRRLSYGTALARHLAHLGMWAVPVLSQLDALFCLWDRPYRQCLHDKAVGTLVLRTRMPAPSFPPPYPPPGNWPPPGGYPPAAPFPPPATNPPAGS